MKKVTILTNFIGYDKKYSLCNVVAEQIGMLKHHGYPYQIIVNEGFQPEPPFTEDVLKFLPNVRVYNEIKKDDTWDKDCADIAKKLDPLLADSDVVFSHDLIYQPAYMKMNVAAKQVAKKYSKIKWLHWIHSSTTPMVLGKQVLGKDAGYLDIVMQQFPNSFVVYPNAFEIPRVARNLGYEEDQVKVVPHATDPADFFGFHPITRELVRKYGLYGADVIAVYPLRLDRGKQPQFCINFMHGIKAEGRSIRMIFCDFHSTGGDKVVYRTELKDLAIKLGLNDHEVVFTSDLGIIKDEAGQPHDCTCGVPRAVVRDLMLLSNLFMLPSRSETYSLVAQEAGLCKNLLVLNYDFPPMRSIYGEDPIYAKFGSNIDALTGLDGSTDVEYTPNVNAYARDYARKICHYLENEKCIAMATKLRKTRNPDYIFKHNLEPLFYA